MRTLGEILNSAKNNLPLSPDESRYAICALSGLSTFDQSDLRHMASAEEEGKKSLWAQSRYSESFRRWKSALAIDPKSWLGPDHDPANPEYRERIALANRAVDAFVDGKKDVFSKIMDGLVKDYLKGEGDGRGGVK